MSDKKLLEEGTIRRFMELANIKPVGNGLLEEKKDTKKQPPHKSEKKKEEKKPVKEGYADEAKMEEEAVEEGTSGPITDRGQSVAEEYHEEGLEEAEGEMETAAPAEGGDSQVRAALEEIKSGVDKLLGMIEGAGDLGMEVEDEEEGGEDMGGEMPEPMGGEGEGAEADEEGLAEEKEVEEAKKAKKEPMEEEALAEELTRRVAARLVAEMKKGGAGAKWGKGTTHAKPPKAGGKPKSPKGYKPAGQTGPKKHKA